MGLRSVRSLSAPGSRVIQRSLVIQRSQTDQRSRTDKDAQGKTAEKTTPQHQKSTNRIVTKTSPGLEIVRVPISVSGWKAG